MHVYHLSTEMKGKNLEFVPKSAPRNTNQASPTIYLTMCKNYKDFQL